MSNIPVYSVVAYSGAGKTTMIERLIAELTRRGLRVGAVKHDAHDFEIDREGKDSHRFTRAGAAVTVIASDKKSAVMFNRYMPLEELIESVTDVDVIITEGFKHGPWPKIALRRKAAGTDFPLPPDTCFAVMSDTPADTAAACLALDDIGALADLIMNDMG